MNEIKIKYVSSNLSKSCFLTENQMKTLGIKDDLKTITLKFGSLLIDADITPLEKEDGDIIELSEDFKKLIHLPENMLLQIKVIEGNMLEFGPYIGVFISSTKAAIMGEGKGDTVYEKLSNATRQLRGICGFFSFSDIDWSKKLIKALILEDTKWVSRIMPIPTVIYDRCFGKYGRENSLKLRRILGKDFKIINSMPKLAKWETIIALRKNPELLSHIPETSQYHSYEDVEMALKKYKALYLKPDLLYKGKGVFKVSLDEKNNYIVEHRNIHDNEIIHLSNLKNLDLLLNKYRAAGGGYLIQKEIKKASFKGYPFDLRVLFQKNWKGLWVVSGIAVRLGAPGSIITSPRSGGAVEEISTILREVFQEDINERNGLYENLINIGRAVVSSIEKEFGDCVELGLDMSIDVNGEIWIIEVNGKPLKVSLKWLNNPIIMDRCYNRPVEYAVFLTGFQSSDLELEG